MYGAFYENVLSPKGWQKKFQQCRKPTNAWSRSIVQWFQPFPHASSMHSNMLPTCFEGPRGRKIGFRSPGLENGVEGPSTKFRQSLRIYTKLTATTQKHWPLRRSRDPTPMEDVPDHGFGVSFRV